MKLDTIYEEFHQRITELSFYRTSMQGLTDRAAGDLDELEKDAHKHPIPDSDVIQIQNVHFRSALTGELAFSGQTISTIENQRKSLLFHENKHHSWILVEFYEEFVSFLFKLYAYAGYKDTNFWPLADYGKIKQSELANKDFNWYLERSKKKNDGHHSILNHLRQHIDSFESIENNNELDHSLRFTTSLIECIRHRAVHNGGVIHDKEAFIKEVMMKSGLYKKGQDYDQRLINFINNYIVKVDGVYRTRLLRITPKNTPLPGFYSDTFRLLTQNLSAHAELIFTCTKQHFSQARS